MSEQATEHGRSEVVASERPLDRQLAAEAALYSVPYSAYRDMSPRERGMVKARWVAALRSEAARRGVDPDIFVAMTEDVREESRKENPERRPVQRRRSARYAGLDLDADSPAVIAPKRSPVADVYDEGLAEGEPHSPMDDVPATEDDPKMRSRPTLGEVRPVDNEDLAGWSNPKNLNDVYARFTIGDGQHFIRVERIDPKVWEQRPCAGFVGEIREPLTETEFQQWFGGRTYSLTVYGPDPKGRKDPSTGLPVIKAKTDPFKLTVPFFPPNLAIPPGISPSKQQKQGATQMQSPPFMMPPFGGGAMPTTQADATMYKSSIDFMSEQLRRGDQERNELRQQLVNGSGHKDVIAAVTETNKVAIDAANKAADAREKALTQQLEQERESRRKLEEKVEKLLEKEQTGRTSPIKDTVELMQAANPGKTAEEQVSRMREIHKEERDRLVDSHKESVTALKDRHDDELKRLRERLDDVEKHSRDQKNEAESRARDREKELRDQMDTLRRDEREAAAQRVAETVTRFEDRIKDLREQHNRELRMQTEQHATRVDTSKGTWEMQLTMAKERIQKLESELEEVREEAESSKDPVQVMEKAKQQAEAMGYKKEDDGPQTPWERFAATTGVGLSKAFESIDQWLPKALDSVRAGQQAPQQQRLLPNPAQQPQRPVPRPAPKRTVAWATQGSIPVAGAQPVIPAQSAPPVQASTFVQAQSPPMAATPVPEQTPVQAPPPPVPQAQGPVQEAAPAPTNGQANNSVYGSIFPDEIILQFKAEVERSFVGGVTPEWFAQRFVEQFPEPSAALVRMHKPEEFFEIVKKMPDGMQSVLVRRDGKKWVEKLWQEIAQRHQALAQPAQQQATPA